MLSIKKISFLTLALLAMNLFNLTAAEDAPIHRFATYNIRYGNAEDTGDKAWVNRKTYVMKIMRDYDFDIAGLQEVTGNNTYPQLQNMQAEMTEYNFIPYERSGTGNYSYNAVMYKKSRYECLDHGCFWISSTPETPSYVWDGTFQRTVVWSKMKDKSTNEIFYFCATHTNGPANNVGRRGAKVITDRLKKIVGNYPMVLVGDFNHRRTDGITTYRGFAANFYDSYNLAENSVSTPIANTTITAQNWYPADNMNISGSEFDYIFCNNIKVLNRYIITENYGRSVNPSDHFPVLITCRIGKETAPKAIHVNQSVASSGDGSIGLPYTTIDEALSVAKIRDTLKVATGTYIPNLKAEDPRTSCFSPQTSVVMIGGYNSGFSEIIGKTTITGDVNNDDDNGNFTDNLYQLIRIPQCYNLTLKNFILEHAYAEGLLNGAALYTEGFELELDNVEFRNNYAANAGGALYASCEYITINNCVFSENKTSGNGGGANITALSDFKLYNSHFLKNEASGGSAMSLSECENSYFQNSTFEGNVSTKHGTLYLQSGDNFISHNLLNNTFANNRLTAASGMATVVKNYGGAAVYAKMSNADNRFNMAHTTIVGNTADYAGTNTSIFNGAAVNIFGGTAVLMNNLIAGNYGVNAHGDLYADANAIINKDSYNVFTSADNVNFTINATDIAASGYEAGINALAQTLNGAVEENKFRAATQTNENYTPTVNIVSPVFNNKPINLLTTNLRLVESAFQTDMNEDGKISGYVMQDQRGKSRKLKSCIGASEYFEEETGLKKTNTANEVNIYRIENSVYEIEGISPNSTVSLYSTLGHCLHISSSSILDLRTYPSGIYLVCINSSTYKIIN